MEELIVCIATPMDLNMDLFSNWANGIVQDSIPTKVDRLEFRHESMDVSRNQEWTAMIRKDREDQYRSFDLLEHYLQVRLSHSINTLQ